MSLVLIVAALLPVIGTEDAATFLRQFAERRQEIRTLTAPFKQLTITPEEQLESKGVIAFRKPRRLAFRYEDPGQVFLLDNLTVYDYDPELKQCQMFELEDDPQTAALFLGFEDDPARLLEAYNVVVDDPSEGMRAIELTPKNENDDEKYFEKIILRIDEKDMLPREIQIVNDAESEVLITIGEYRINGRLAVEQTRLDLPEGTDILMNDDFVETVGPRGKRLPEGPAEE
ncbi:MAG: outer membrane lipoprotein carrier protein LolA [Candidatus Hydrogenedentota bacterium]